MSLIILRLAGGLGNQLFQLAAAMHLAKMKKMSYGQILVDFRYLSKYDSARDCELKFITDIIPEIKLTNILPFPASIASQFRLGRIFDKKIGSYELISTVSHLKKVSASDEYVKFYILDGYFQDPTILFSENDRVLIRDALISSKANILKGIINGYPTIGIHIRRGDYLTSKSAAKVFRTIPLHYYDDALSGIRKHHNVIVFSDDRQLSANYSAKIRALDSRRLNLSLDNEFCMLMACDDYIIANSTFSWWASYLGYSLNRRIICPKNWYKDEIRNNSNPLLLPNFEIFDV